MTHYPKRKLKNHKDWPLVVKVISAGTGLSFPLKVKLEFVKQPTDDVVGYARAEVYDGDIFLFARVSPGTPWTGTSEYGCDIITNKGISMGLRQDLFEIICNFQA